MRIDLNADVGESFGAYTIGLDAALLPSMTSVSIAAGFHGGDPSVLRATIRQAKAHGVAIGAHPGFPDLAGFGRRDMQITPAAAEDLILYQIAAVAGVARAEGVAIQHVKVHGALYNRAAVDRPLADALARAVAAFDRSLVIYAPPESEMVRAADAFGLRVAREAFADRAYEPTGQLVSRQESGAVLVDPDTVAARAVRMVRDRIVLDRNGRSLPIEADTLCLHGDTPGADRIAAAVRTGLERSGIVVEAVGRNAER
jgi:UPF0271 protein